MPLGTFVEDSGGAHGLALGPTDSVFATTRDATDASSVQTTDASDNPRTNKNGANYEINRYFLAFDTSSIPFNSTINSGTLTLTAGNPALSGGNADSTHLCVAIASQADPDTALGVGAYNDLSFTSAGSFALASMSADTAFDISIGTNAIPYTFTKYALINSRDLNNSAPTGLNGCNIYTINNGTATVRPTLVLNYSPPTNGLDLTSKSW